MLVTMFLENARNETEYENKKASLKGLKIFEITLRLNKIDERR